MACFQREIIEAHREFAASIWNFLYVDGKGKKGFQTHTEEEYQTFLNELNREMFDTYTDTAREMGWVE